MDIIKAHAINNLCYIASQKMIPKGIVVHSTGANNPYLKRYVDCPDEVGVNKYGNHWNKAKPGNRKVCVHAFIGYDKNKNIRVAEILPLNICCWGVGKGSKGSYNYSPAYIQFEVCEDNLKDRDYYQKAFNVAAEYCAKLCTDYGISVDKIVGHYEAHKQGYGSNHGDPEHWMKNFGETMTDFRNKVSKILENAKSTGKDDYDTEKTDADFSCDINAGDLVSISENALYYSGEKIPNWVKKQLWFVKEKPENDRVVIDKNEKGTNSICSPIHKNYLNVVKAATTQKTSVSENECPYLVKVTASVLTIRKAAGTNNEKVGAITDKGVYTIVAEENGPNNSKWGKLKSGIGWICMDYVKKI